MSNFNNLCSPKLQLTKRLPELCITQALCFLPQIPTNTGENLNEHEKSHLSVKEQERSLIQLFVCSKTAWRDRFWLCLQNWITPGIKEIQLQVSPTNLMLHPELHSLFHNKSHFLVSIRCYIATKDAFSYVCIVKQPKWLRVTTIMFLFKQRKQILLKLNVLTSLCIRTWLQKKGKIFLCNQFVVDYDLLLFPAMLIHTATDLAKFFSFPEEFNNKPVHSQEAQKN